MPTDHTDFPQNYAEARGRFRAAVAAAGGRSAAYPIDAKGPDGKDLTIDVAFFGGTSEPERQFLVSSGLHGVEGFFGSAIQLAWLLADGRSWQPPAGLGLIMAHGLNPYGFAWRRRWDENNIDLNRNFLLDRSFLTTDPRYAESRKIYEKLRAFLNPSSPPSRAEPYMLKIVHVILRQGLEARRQMPSRDRPWFWDVRRCSR
jgi:hypothetical protein